MFAFVHTTGLMRSVLVSLQMERFRLVCEVLATALVEDLHAPLEFKRIQPVSTSGIAGGEKFVQGNVFLKFARDVHGVYGGALCAGTVCVSQKPKSVE